ncbi:MAG: hypothetical protein J2P26_14340 [Nocardiopsaceae bacterium]|nr:hypothetical protein [Nocardiopsaceae bacterium]
MYLWKLLTGKPGDSPYMLGITDNLTHARRVAEPYLESGQARVCYIDQARFAMTTSPDMSSSYACTGRYWSGERNRRGRVTWSEHWGTRERSCRGTARWRDDPDGPGWSHATTDLY